VDAGVSALASAGAGILDAVKSVFFGVPKILNNFISHPFGGGPPSSSFFLFIVTDR